MFQRFFEEGLAQASYLVGCDRTREAVIIDPRRDVDTYVSLARQHGLTIVAAIETHIHADFVSGARELAATGARVLAGPGSNLWFDFHEVRHNESLAVGDVTLEFLHTPGHTPEHVCVLATQPDGRNRVFTGDTLFAGAVGRPDLLGPEQMRDLAGQLYDSLTSTLLTLDDSVEVHPGHGAGSLCGASGP
jgi:hydroxyacylglutathione hydrolase